MTTIPFGDDARLIRLEDAAGGGFLELLEYGATLRSVALPDREGRLVDVCLGYDSVEEYRRCDAYVGGIVGRCAGRVAGASCSLGGRTVALSANDPPNHLHGGFEGFNRKRWTLADPDQRDAVTLTLHAPDGEEGYPGDLEVAVTYRLNGGLLSIDFDAVSSADTLLNLTSHGYWDLAGQGQNSLASCLLELTASSYAEMGDGLLPTGRLLPVAATPLDFSAPTPIGARLSDPALAAAGGGYDHCLALPPPGPDGLRTVGRAVSPVSGIVMEVATTAPGVIFYTANAFAERRGKGGAVYRPQGAFCLEAQGFPDAVHHPGFPSPVLRAGVRWHQRTEYRFSLQKGV